MTRFTYYFKKHSFIQLIPNVGSALSQALGSEGEWTECIIKEMHLKQGLKSIVCSFSEMNELCKMKYSTSIKT